MKPITISSFKTFGLKLWNYVKQARMEVIIALSVFIVDLVSKALINEFIPLGSSVEIIPKFLSFTNVHNYNTAFGIDWISKALGETGARVLMSIFQLAATVLFVIFMVKKKGSSKLLLIALALLSSGALGNGIDRIFYGYVRDFVEIFYFGGKIAGSYSFYVFNIADSALVIGVILALVYFIFIYKDTSSSKNDKTNSQDDDANKSDESDDSEAVSDEVTAGIPPTHTKKHVDDFEDDEIITDEPTITEGENAQATPNLPPMKVALNEQATASAKENTSSKAKTTAKEETTASEQATASEKENTSSKAKTTAKEEATASEKENTSSKAKTAAKSKTVAEESTSNKVKTKSAKDEGGKDGV